MLIVCYFVIFIHYQVPTIEQPVMYGLVKCRSKPTGSENHVRVLLLFASDIAFDIQVGTQVTSDLH